MRVGCVGRQAAEPPPGKRGRCYGSGPPHALYGGWILHLHPKERDASDGEIHISNFNMMEAVTGSSAYSSWH